MSRRVRRCLQWYAAAWAGFGFATVIAVMDDVNADAVVIVIAVAIISSTAALAAVALLGHCRDRAAGASLLLSSAMPTFLWYPLNIGSLVCGTALLLTAGLRPTDPLRRIINQTAPIPARSGENPSTDSEDTPVSVVHDVSRAAGSLVRLRLSWLQG